MLLIINRRTYTPATYVKEMLLVRTFGAHALTLDYFRTVFEPSYLLIFISNGASALLTVFVSGIKSKIQVKREDEGIHAVFIKPCFKLLIELLYLFC